MTQQASPDPAGFRGPWCTKCGSAAVVLFETLDPRYPMVKCKRGYPDSAGCGDLIGSRVLADAEAAYRARRRKLTEARHKQHPADRPGKYANWCRHCEAIEAANAHHGTTAVGTQPAGANGR